MLMMSKLLGNLGKLWNKAPKDFEALSIQRERGNHSFVTINTQQIIFHSTTYHKDMPNKQTILLEGHTLLELTETISSLGYVCSLTSEAIGKGYAERKAYTLMPVENVPIIYGSFFKVFTSPLWQLLYPLARVLEDLDYDTDDAINQLCAGSASRSWLDYWASFFKLTRAANESDADFEKRIFIKLLSVKTSAIAIQELLKHAVSGVSVVTDVAPAQFSVTADPVYMDTAEAVRRIVNSAKGAGIDYFLNYQRTSEELFKAYFKDMYGEDFETSDKQGLQGETKVAERLPYGYYVDQETAFKLGKSPLGTGGRKLLTKAYFLRDDSSAQLSMPNAEVSTRLKYTSNPFTLGSSLISTDTSIGTDALFNLENGASIESFEVISNLFEIVSAGMDSSSGALASTFFEEPYLGQVNADDRYSHQVSLTSSDTLISLQHTTNPFTLGFSLINADMNVDTDALFNPENGTSVATMTFTQGGVVVRSEMLNF